MRWLALLLLIPLSVEAVPACWPKDAGGTGSPIVLRAGIAGLAYGWYCPVGKIQSVAGPWSAFIPTFEVEARRLASASDADKQAAWAKYVTRTTALSAGVETLRLSVVADVKARYAP